MAGSTLIFQNPDKNTFSHFEFDKCYWSHDGYDDNNGLYVAKPGSAYAD